jgi:hypothetical protein
VGELITTLSRLDVSPFVALLLVALLAALRSIGNSLTTRLARAETRLDELEDDKHRHATSLAVIKARLDIVEDNADNVS